MRNAGIGGLAVFFKVDSFNSPPFELEKLEHTFLKSHFEKIREACQIHVSQLKTEYHCPSTFPVILR